MALPLSNFSLRLMHDSASSRASFHIPAFAYAALRLDSSMCEVPAISMASEYMQVQVLRDESRVERRKASKSTTSKGGKIAQWCNTWQWLQRACFLSSGCCPRLSEHQPLLLLRVLFANDVQLTALFDLSKTSLDLRKDTTATFRPLAPLQTSLLHQLPAVARQHTRCCSVGSASKQ